MIFSIAKTLRVTFVLLFIQSLIFIGCNQEQNNITCEEINLKISKFGQPTINISQECTAYDFRLDISKCLKKSKGKTIVKVYYRGTQIGYKEFNSSSKFIFDTKEDWQFDLALLQNKSTKTIQDKFDIKISDYDQPGNVSEYAVSFNVLGVGENTYNETYLAEKDMQSFDIDCDWRSDKTIQKHIGEVPTNKFIETNYYSSLKVIKKALPNQKTHVTFNLKTVHIDNPEYDFQFSESHILSNVAAGKISSFNALSSTFEQGFLPKSKMTLGHEIYKVPYLEQMHKINCEGQDTTIGELVIVWLPWQIHLSSHCVKSNEQ